MAAESVILILRYVDHNILRSMVGTDVGASHDGTALLYKSSAQLGH